MKKIKVLALLLVAGLSASITHSAAAADGTLRAPVVLGDVPAMTDTANDTAPNVLVIFDDSWSMNRPYLPDRLRHYGDTYYVEFRDSAFWNKSYNPNRPDDSLWAWNWDTTIIDLDDFGHVQRASALNIDSSGQQEWDPPMLTAAFNKMTYNPEVNYLPPQVVGGWKNLPLWAQALVQNTGEDVVTYPEMNEVNTAGWTRIPQVRPRDLLVPLDGWWSDDPPMVSLMGMYVFSVYDWTKQTAPITVNYMKDGLPQTIVYDPNTINNYGIKLNAARGFFDNDHVVNTVGRWKKYFVDLNQPEVKELFGVYCPEGGTTWDGCWPVHYLPLHYFKSSIKWCTDENPTWDSGKKPRWPGFGTALDVAVGFADGYGDKFNNSCVSEEDSRFDPKIYRYPYFYAPHADVQGSVYYGQTDNRQYNPFVPVVLDFNHPEKIYKTEYVDESGQLQVITRTFAEELTNYMNWYVYYGLREYALKTIASRVFTTVPPETHVGLVRMRHMSYHWGDVNDSAGNSKGLNFISIKELNDNLYVAPFTGEHRERFYNLLFTRMMGPTPLDASDPDPYLPRIREAAQAAGKYFAAPTSYGKSWESIAAMANPWSLSPARYACQRNQVLLFTAGNWADTNRWYFGDRNNIDDTLIWNLPDSNVEVLGQKLKKGDKWPRPIQHGKSSTAGLSTSADIGLYYWSKNLQPNMVDGSTTRPFKLISSVLDPATWPHLSFSVLGFGLFNKLPANDQVKTLNQVIDGTLDWPPALGTSDADYYSPNRVDDLWHMTVNSFGTYMPTQSPEEAELDLRLYLNNINSIGGSLASTQSNSNDLRSDADDKMVFVPSFNADWSGDIKAYKLNTSTATTGEQVWSAASLLNAKLRPDADEPTPWLDKRKIFTFKASDPQGSGVFTQQVDLKWENLSGAQQTALGNTQELQKKVVAYLRGDQSNEGAGHGTFRQRSFLLGDIVNAELVFAGPPTRNFDLTLNCGYKEYKQANSQRKKVIFAAANDGMLHAFDEKTGEELWAFMPANLFRPAENGGIGGRVARTLLSNDVDEGNDTLVPVDPDQGLPPAKENKVLMHRYYLDATPQLMDAQIDGNWRTVLVGGLGKGGSSYYALDVTDPDNPKALWEYTDSNMGYTYGRPVITKTMAGADGDQCNNQWLVLLPSGLNNGVGRGQAKSGDGKARLYIRNLKDGSEWRPPLTGSVAGTPGWPSGLGWISSYIDNDQVDQVARSVYGGDQRGDLWRFDLDDQNSQNWSAQLLADHLVDSNNNRQPVSTRPSLLLTRDSGVSAGGATRWVMVGTGRITSRADAESKIANSFYAFRDGTRNAAATSTISDRSQMTQVSDSTGVVPGLGVDGWYQDFASGWHVVTDPVAFGAKLADGTTARALVVYSTVHSPKWLASEACVAQKMDVHTYFRDVTTGELTYEYESKGFPGTPQLFFDKDGGLNIGITYGEQLKLFSWKEIGMPPLSNSSPDYLGKVQRYMMRFIE